MRLAANEVPVAALVHHDDTYVDITHALRTSRAIRGRRTRVTDEFERDGPCAGGPRTGCRASSATSSEHPHPHNRGPYRRRLDDSP
ncbi:hypothetical protein ABT236_16550 [Streptomyces sp. NPDC001523]|uniref:hypothetical protein n=1 Tax=Streptomyces sp. NPDC001523 TaxID=3154383 RepID=UPI0033311391